MTTNHDATFDSGVTLSDDDDVSSSPSRSNARRQEPVNLAPLTTYEVLTRQMVDDLAREVSATRQRVDTMFYLIISSIALDLLLRLG